MPRNEASCEAHQSQLLLANVRAEHEKVTRPAAVGQRVAKRENNYFGFGSDNEMEMQPSYLIIKHYTFSWRSLGDDPRDGARVLHDDSPNMVVLEGPPNQFQG